MSSAALLRLSRRHLRRFSLSSSPNPNPNSVSDNPYPKSLNTTINKLFKERDPDKLVAGFKKCSASYRFRCRHRIYDHAVARLSAAGRPDAVRALLEDQKRYADDLHREGFAVRLIALYGRAGLPADASATFRQLPDFDCPRTAMSFNALLTAFADSKDYDRLTREFQEIPSTDPSIVPNVISYNILIRALCEKCDFDAAFDALDLMERNGISTDLISFNTLLHAFYRNGRFSDAEKVWAKMRERSVEPDIKSFNAKLEGLVLEGRTLEVEKLVDELMHAGPKPDSFTFNALIKGYCKDGRLEEAKRVYMDLTKNDCAPNKGTFETLVPGVCEAGEIDLALKMCNDSISRKCFVDVEVLQGVVDGLAKDSKMEDAKKLVDLGRANGYQRKRLRIPSP